MENLKKQHPPPFKAKGALEALKEIKASAELASEFQAHPTHFVIKLLPCIMKTPL